MNKINNKGVIAFLIVLLSMPLGHAAMILMEHFLKGTLLNIAAFLLGVFGLILTYIGSLTSKDIKSTLLGFFGSLLVWTGWIEFGYMYFANKLAVAPIIENGEITTKPEYLLMMSSIGFLIIFNLFYIFKIKNGCTMYSSIQRKIKIKTPSLNTTISTNKSFTTFMESTMLLWTSYLLLMFAYDKDILGDRHPLTIAIAMGCLIWSIFLFRKLIKIKTIGPAIRYALPTVIIFWTFVEVMGRIGIMKEIWVNPLQYKLEMIVMLSVMFICFIYIRFKKLN
jgi:hypothetical protein